MDTCVTFRSRKCLIDDIELRQLPGCSEEKLVGHVAHGLAQRGWQGNHFAKDWGWVILINNPSFRLWIGVIANFEHDDGFACFIKTHTWFVKRWFRPVETDATVERLLGDLVEVIASAADDVAELATYPDLETAMEQRSADGSASSVDGNDSRKTFGDVAFSGSRFIFWALAPVLLLGGISVPLFATVWTPVASVCNVVWCAGCLLAIPALYDARRFWWAARSVTFIIFCVYAFYVLDQLFLSWKSKELAHNGATSLIGSVIGFIIIGLPAFSYTFSGRFRLAEKEKSPRQE